MSDNPNSPWLTQKRWYALQAFKRQPHLMDRPFVAKELLVNWRWNDELRPATGPAMESLREAGWVTKVVVAQSWGNGSFRMGRIPHAWEITDAGRKAVDDCPDVFPGVPVYRATEE